MSFNENRCKFCANRNVFWCPIKRRIVEPDNEVSGCDTFVGKDRGLPPEEKKRGSLGGGCGCGK